MQFYTIDSIVELCKLKTSVANKISLATKSPDHACPAPSFDHALAWDTSGWCLLPLVVLFHQCDQPVSSQPCMLLLLKYSLTRVFRMHLRKLHMLWTWACTPIIVPWDKNRCKHWDDSEQQQWEHSSLGFFYLHSWELSWVCSRICFPIGKLQYWEYFGGTHWFQQNIMHSCVICFKNEEHQSVLFTATIDWRSSPLWEPPNLHSV